MKLTKKISFLVSAIALGSLTGFSAMDDKPAISANSIEAHVAFLADDYMKGRDSTSKEYLIAANYLASLYSQWGLKPAGDNGTYFQSVPFRKAKLDKSATTFVLKTEKGDKELKFGDDYLISSNTYYPDSTADAPIVFAGYGIDAPAFGISDYAGLDVKGKIVLLLDGSTPTLPSEAGAHFGYRDTKDATAMAHGAVGVLIMESPVSYRKYDGRKKYYMSAKDKVDIIRDSFDKSAIAPLKALISPELAKTMITSSDKNYDQIMEEAKKGSVKGFPINASMKMTQKTDYETIASSPNVAAVLPGTDPALKDDYIIITAHLDHVGWRPEEKGDNIYNGALDNAIGVAAMLEIAHNFTLAKKAPRRSIMFLALTAEEKGLLGADYFAHTPTVPVDKIKANVNLDMPVVVYDFADMIAFGADHSTIGPVAAKAAAKIGVSLSPDPVPEEHIFVRSDHYRFVQQGIPSVMMDVGWKSTNKEDPEEGTRKYKDFLENRYHKPSDQLADDINWQAAVKFAMANYFIIDTLANDDNAPRWYKGDVFGDAFAKDADKAPLPTAKAE